LEASAVAHASRRGLLARRSPILRLQKDDRLVELIREGHPRAFEVLFDRYQGRLLAFCRNMLACEQDAEDVLQEVFVAAHRAMLADERYINVRPWLYRIARNRCLNHLRKPTAEGKDTMDEHVHENGTTTAEHVQQREELREVMRDVHGLPETQRTALLLREAEALSYAEIAQAMGTTVPAVKSLLVRARISLAEASQARLLTCGEVRLTLAEAAEGIGKADGAVRQHIRRCEECKDFRENLDASSKALAALFPIGTLAAFKTLVASKLGFGGSSAGAGAGATGGGGAAAGGAVTGGSVAGGAAAGGAGISGALGGAAAAAGGAGGIGGAISGAIGAKAAAGVATAAIVAAGAVEVKEVVTEEPASSAPVASALASEHAASEPRVESRHAHPALKKATVAATAHPAATRDASAATTPEEPAAPTPPAGDTAEESSGDAAATTEAPAGEGSESAADKEATAPVTTPDIETNGVTQTAGEPEPDPQVAPEPGAEPEPVPGGGPPAATAPTPAPAPVPPVSGSGTATSAGGGA
jgi:RNA polymerase sigma factor (sigma-70 family)